MVGRKDINRNPHYSDTTLLQRTCEPGPPSCCPGKGAGVADLRAVGMEEDVRSIPEQKGSWEGVPTARNSSLYSQGPEPWEITFAVVNKKVMNY